MNQRVCGTDANRNPAPGDLTPRSPCAADVWCVIPVRNNAATVRQVVLACREFVTNVVVVDDGSTDADLTSLLDDTGIPVLRHAHNRGKGAAILTALEFVQTRGGRFLITIDGDGQHFPRDLAKFLPLLAETTDDFVVIGQRDMTGPQVPRGSRFGMAFSDFWVRAETGVAVRDSQSGFRAYPLRHLARLSLRSRRYGFEIEALVKLLWAGLTVKAVNVEVNYPERDRRVSSFRPFLDNLRISGVHTMLVGRRLMPWPHRRFVPSQPWDRKEMLALLLHPARFLRKLLQEHATPLGLAAAAFVGTFLGVLPILFTHSLVIAYVATRLNLNKIMALSIQIFCSPPFIPLVCIETGHLLLHGCLLTNLTRETVVDHLGDRLIEWLLGSLLVAPIAAALMAAVVFFLAKSLRRRVAANA